MRSLPFLGPFWGRTRGRSSWPSPALPVRLSRMRYLRVLVLAAAVVLPLSACAGYPGSRDADDELTGVALVLDDGQGSQVHACFGFVQQSLPPKCSGPVVHGWDWSAVDEEETAAGVTFGEYDVTGTWGGTALTLTQPATVAGPTPGPDATTEPAGQEPDPASVKRAFDDEDPPWQGDDRAVFMEYGDGPLKVTIVFDDGRVQDAADAKYGEGVVQVSSALRSIGDAQDR